MTDTVLTYIEDTITHYLRNWDKESARSTKNSKMEAPGLRRSIVINVEDFINDVKNRPAIWSRNYHCNKSFLEQTWQELANKYNLPKITLKTKWKGLRDNFRVEFKKIPRNDTGDMLIPPEEFESKWIHYYSLLFLVNHMRHRNPPQSGSVLPFYLFQQTQQFPDDDYEETLVEPDLTTGLITIDDDDDDEVEDSKKNGQEKPPASQPSYSNEAAEANNSNDSAIYSATSIRRSSYAASSSTTSSTSADSKILLNTLKQGSRKRSRDAMENEDIEDLESQNDPDDDYYYLLSLLPYMKQLNASQKLRLRTKIQRLIFKELYKEDIEEGK